MNKKQILQVIAVPLIVSVNMGAGLPETFAAIDDKSWLSPSISIPLKQSEINLVQNNFSRQKNKKIIICHYPPGNPGNAQTITISENAWPAHEAHGDTLGPCPEPPVSPG